ncbi:hypothetical protein DFP72DRAFT_555736 [Ephemerocybe angulata]|uniref:Uncharacterized protein n=1 Tax=Ephemerocybe angulata TaxID=980116 RepID=A0A8H6LYE6_9AGAR|nr:hypothetical protein DFP72DRAFT_555736 [Tulosesus angulatus]
MPTTTRAAWRIQQYMTDDEPMLRTVATPARRRPSPNCRTSSKGHGASSKKEIEIQNSNDSEIGRVDNLPMGPPLSEDNMDDDPLEGYGMPENQGSTISMSSSDIVRDNICPDHTMEDPVQLSENEDLSDQVVIRTLTKPRNELRLKAKALQRPSDIVRGDGRVLQVEHEKLLVYCRRLEGDLKSSRDDNRQSKAVITTLRRECEAAKSKLKVTKLRLAECEEDLDSAQQFLNTADAVEIAEVTRMVDRLNDAIEGLASTLGNEIIRAARARARSKPPRYATEARTAVTQMWGKKIVDCMTLGMTMRNSTIFAALAQSVLSNICLTIVRAFCLEDDAMNEKVASLWVGINENCDLGVAKRWRSLTNAQLQPRGDTIAAITASAAQSLSYLMVTAGWRQRTPDKLPPYVKGKLDDIFADALGVRRTVIDDVLSADLEVIKCENSTPFLHKEMRDALKVEQGDGKDASLLDGEPIVCCTGIGMRYTSWKKGKRVSKVLLKSKVLMPSALRPKIKIKASWVS